MADALVDYGRSLSIEPKPEDVEDFENFPGEGIHGRIDGKDIYIGNKRISRKAGCETGECHALTSLLSTVVFTCKIYLLF